MKLIYFLSLAVLALNLASCGSPTAKALKAKPNVLLIVVDDQGYADYSPFPNHDITAATPNIGKLGRSGTVFTQAYVSAPVCSPSRVGMLTGKNQFRWDVPASWGPGLPEEVKTIAEYLREAGYATARIGKNDLGRNFHRHDVREYPLRHGYDEFLGFSAHAHDFWLHSADIRDRTPDPANTSAVLGPLMHNEGEKSYEEGYLTDILTDEAINYMAGREGAENPFFLTLSYSAVHHLIHEVPKKYLDKYGAEPIANFDPDSSPAYNKFPAGSYSAYYDRYSRVGDIDADGMRRYYLANLNSLDDNVGRVLDALKAKGLDKNTLVVYVSDNGGSPLTGANNAPLTAGKYSLFEGGIRVPMSISFPGKIPSGKVEDRYVSALDILPTVADFVNIELPDTELDGRSLLDPEKDRLLVWKWQKTFAVRRGNYKLTNSHENHWKSDPTAQYIAPVVDNKELKLFDVENDPGERVDLAQQLPEVVESLKTAYEYWCTMNIGKY